MAAVIRRGIGSLFFFASGYGTSHTLTQQSTNEFVPRALSEQKQEILNNIHLDREYASVIADPDFQGGTLAGTIPKSYRKNHVAQGLLYGRSLFEIDPMIFLNRKSGELVAFYHIGHNLKDSNGKLHHGVLGLLLDEGLCFCGFPQLPSKRGVTGRLTIDYLNTIPPDKTLVLRAKVTQSKGRKVVIDGDIHTLAGSSKALGGKVLAKGHCILIEPKWFKYFNWLDLFKAN